IQSDQLCIELVNETAIHRSLYILEGLFNSAERTILFLMLAGCGVGQIVSAVVLIQDSGSNLIPLPWKLFFVAAIFEASFIFLVYGFTRDYNQDSANLMKHLRDNVKEPLKR